MLIRKASSDKRLFFASSTPLPYLLVMPKKRIPRFTGDVREHPRYSIEEAADYLHIPPSTMKAWLRGQHYRLPDGRIRDVEAVVQAADPAHKLISFYNLAEAHILRATRDRDIPLKNVRAAIHYVRQIIPNDPHPLLSHKFSTYGKQVFIEHLGQIVNATRHGQLGMREILEQYLERIERDSLGKPRQVFPIYSSHIAINPFLSSGKPVVRGTGIMLSILIDRAKSGESIPDLAQDYGLQPLEIQEAIQEYAAA
jgi:uncharacterized protein (DUF433 family)